MGSVEWGELCRLCAKNSSSLSCKINTINKNKNNHNYSLRIHEPGETGDNNDNIVDITTSGNLIRYNSYIEAVFTYSGIQISLDDAYPKIICGLCAKKLEDFDNFIESCLNVQKYFEKIAEIYPGSSQHLNFQNIKSEFSLNNSFVGCDIKQEDEPLVKEEPDINEDYSNSFFDNGYDNDEFSLPLIAFQKNRKKNKRKKIKTKKKDLSDSDEFLIDRDDCNYQIFSCDQCPHFSKSEKAFERHKMKHIPKPERIFGCASCPKTFTSKENLKSHERVHIPLYERYNYECDICGNKFTTKSAVVGHKRAVHEKIKRYICDVCGYACSTGGELIQHRAIHSDEKQFQCNRCPKKFKTGSNLKAHLDTHDTTSYPCSLCEKVLNSRRTLRKHMLVHEDVCRHVCSFCNKAFKRRQTLKVHLTSHTGDTPIQCPWCPQKFAYSSACRTHKQRCHHEQMAQLATGQILLSQPNSNIPISISSMINSINPSTVQNIQTITVHNMGIPTSIATGIPSSISSGLPTSMSTGIPSNMSSGIPSSMASGMTNINVQDVPVEITLQSVNIIPQYEINLPTKVESD